MPTPHRSKSFSLINRVKSFAHAGRGIQVFIRTTHNSWIQLLILIAVIILGIYFHIPPSAWMMIVFATGLVLSAEAFNTSIEYIVDLASPDLHPNARDAKDVAAGAVLIAAITAATVGLCIFIPYLVAVITS